MGDRRFEDDKELILRSEIVGAFVVGEDAVRCAIDVWSDYLQTIGADHTAVTIGALIQRSLSKFVSVRLQAGIGGGEGAPGDLDQRLILYTAEHVIPLKRKQVAIGRSSSDNRRIVMVHRRSGSDGIRAAGVKLYGKDSPLLSVAIRTGQTFTGRIRTLELGDE